MCGVLAKMYPPEDGFSLHSVLSIITNQLHCIIHNTQQNLQHNFTESGEFSFITKPPFIYLKLLVPAVIFKAVFQRQLSLSKL